MSADITPEVAAKFEALRAAFAPEYIGKLPKVTCKACSDNKQQKHCQNHQRRECPICKNYITTAHIHLDYIGHAETTDRLLKVDPSWTWEPQARDVNPQVLAAALATGNPEIVRMVIESAPPKLDQFGGMWINLTVCGVTRPGYGDATGKPAGPTAIKEVIGDAIRNASMRFGAGLDLWSKSDMGEIEAERLQSLSEQDRAAEGPVRQVGSNGNGRPVQAVQQRSAQSSQRPAPQTPARPAVFPHVPCPQPPAGEATRNQMLNWMLAVAVWADDRYRDKDDRGRPNGKPNVPAVANAFAGFAGGALNEASILDIASFAAHLEAQAVQSANGNTSAGVAA